MKEYWVNVYEWGCSALYPNKDNCIDWNKEAYNKKLVLYRIHVKMKEHKSQYEELSQHMPYSKHERVFKQPPPGKNWMDN